jgi:hypothetical protein
LPSSEQTEPSPPPRLALYVGLCGVAASSLLLLKLAPFVLVAVFIAYLALPRGVNRLLSWLTLAAGVLAMIGFFRFLIVEAMPGIVEAGTRATEDTAVSKLREILFAEDSMRRRADVDPDHDGIGSAGLLDELTGRVALRGVHRLEPPILERYPLPLETALGPAVPMGGYLFIICLPTPGGGWTARPASEVDEEAAERHFVAYAWPAADKRGLLDAFFIDEHERILFSHSGEPEGHRSRLGLERPPTCDDALAPKTREAWQAWKGKRPRTTLPGDR